MVADTDLVGLCQALQEQVEALRKERDELRGRQDFAVTLEAAVKTRSKLLSNQEFALLYFPDTQNSEKRWLAAMGNSNRAVVITETGGDLEAWGPTAKDAVNKMLERLRRAEDAMRDILKGDT